MTAIAVPLPRRRPGVGTIYAWELRKLRAQRRTYIGLGAAVLVPLVFIFALLTSNGGPEEIPFGRYVRDSGLAIPLVSMFFGSIWFFPLVTALVSGDIVAAEDGNGTLKTILTRSAERWQIFAAKVMAALSYTFAALLMYMLVGLVIGGLVYGFNPLVSLSGTHISVGRGLALTAAGGLAYFVPMIAVAAIALMLSTLSRNSAAAVVGTLMISLIMQLLGAINALSFLHPYLLSEQFNAWEGFLREPIDWAPVGHAAWVAAAYAIPALVVSFIAFLRRDVAGG